MENSGNPAQRLYDIVMKVNSSLNEVRSTGNSNPASWQVWVDLFEIETEDGESLLDQQLQLINRLNQCRKLVEEVEDLLLKNKNINHQKLLKPFPKFKDLFPLPLELTSTFSYAGINAADQAILDICIDGIEATHKEKVVNEKDLKELLSEIQSLYEQILSVEMDDNLKKSLLNMLKIMENAIHEYRIRGVERLHEAIEQLIGIYIMNEQKIMQSNSKEVGKVKSLLSKFGSLYSFAADTVQLLGASEIITKFLGK